MATAVLPRSPAPDIQRLCERMGRVNHQPVSVHSFTNKRFTVNFRVPLNSLRRILPSTIAPDEIGNNGFGMIGMCACDFWVTRFGWIPVPRIRNNDMLCRISVTIVKNDQRYRAFYTVGSSSSSILLGSLGMRFSHFRKRLASFRRIDNAQKYSLECHAADPLRSGRLDADVSKVNKTAPASSIFADVDEATDFVFNLDGSCGYDFGRRKLSFQKIDYPKWDMYFCHQLDYDFPLLDHLKQCYRLDMEFDSILFMQNTPQTWRSSWLYDEP